MTWTLLRTAVLAVAALTSSSALAGYSLQPYTTYQTLSWPDAVAIGDVNGDGRNDVVLTTMWYGSAEQRRGEVIVRLDNIGTGDAVQAQVDVGIAVANGTLELGALPAGCDLIEQASLRANVRCIDATLAADTSRTRVLTLSVSGGTRRNAISVLANASTSTVELRTDNNTASKRLQGAIGVVSPVPARTLPAAQTTQKARLRTER